MAAFLSRHALAQVKDKATRLRLEAMLDDEEAYYEGLAREEAEARDRARGNLLTKGASGGQKTSPKAQARAAKAVLAAAS